MKLDKKKLNKERFDPNYNNHNFVPDGRQNYGGYKICCTKCDVKVLFYFNAIISYKYCIRPIDKKFKSVDILLSCEDMIIKSILE